MTGSAVSLRSLPQVQAITPVADRLYLHPGQLAVAASPCTLATILGSCVAVCLHDAGRRIGGLNHFLLPTAPGRESNTRYGDIATQRLLQEMQRLGSAPEDLTAAVIGGACVLDAYQARRAELGTNNVRIAIAMLSDAGIRVERQETGGSRGRRVAFHVHDGTIDIKTL